MPQALGRNPFSARPNTTSAHECVYIVGLAVAGVVGVLYRMHQVDDVVSTEVEQTVVSLSAAKMDEVSGDNTVVQYSSTVHSEGDDKICENVWSYVCIMYK